MRRPPARRLRPRGSGRHHPASAASAPSPSSASSATERPRTWPAPASRATTSPPPSSCSTRWARWTASPSGRARAAPPEELRDDIAAVLPPGTEALTGPRSPRRAPPPSARPRSLHQVLLVFAAVSLLVGAFVIWNTFDVLVAQRRREIALLRAVGATRRQIMGGIITEASTIGLLSAGLGLGAGVGLAIGHPAACSRSSGSRSPRPRPPSSHAPWSRRSRWE